MLVFNLSMPNAGSWNGKWSGEGRLYAKVRKLGKEKEVNLDGTSYRYRWDDGWCASVDVYKVDAKEANKIRRKSVGFYGYDWMINSIIEHGDIRLPEDDK